MTLPLAVIGGGSIGLRHATQADAAESIRLTAIVEPHAGRREELQAMSLPAVADIAAVPEDTRAAVIATPTPDHAASAMAALARGWALLVEKPLTETLTEADALCDAAGRAGLPLVTAHHRRCHPFVAEARRLMDRIGDPVLVQGIWSLRKHDSYYDPEWRRSAGAGPILTNLSHEIDLLRHLAGEITQVSALTSNTRRGLPIEDTAAITLRFASGALGTFAISDAGASPWAFEAACGENPDLATSGQDAMRFVGTRGALSFPSLELWEGADNWREPQRRTPGPDLPRVDPIRAQLERFAAHVNGAADATLATGSDGRAVLAVTRAVIEAARTGAPVQPQQMTTRHEESHHD